MIGKRFHTVVDGKPDQKLQITTVTLNSNFIIPAFISTRGMDFDLSFFSFQNQVGLFGHNADHTFLKRKIYYRELLQNSSEYSKYLEDVLASDKFRLKDAGYSVMNRRRFYRDSKYLNDLRKILGSYLRKKHNYVYYTVRTFSLKK